MSIVSFLLLHDAPRVPQSPNYQSDYWDRIFPSICDGALQDEFMLTSNDQILKLMHNWIKVAVKHVVCPHKQGKRQISVIMEAELVDGGVQRRMDSRTYGGG